MKASRTLPSELTPRRAALVTAIAVLCVALVSASPWGDEIESGLPRRLAFQLRHRLDRDPRLDPRIKIYAFGDSSIPKLDDEEPTLAEWELVLKALSASRPRAVFLNRIFGFTRREPPERIEAFTRAVAGLEVPVITTAFVSPAPLPGRPELPLDVAPYELDKWVDDGPGGGHDLEKLDWLPVVPGHVYGAAQPLRPAFRRAGHANHAVDGPDAVFLRVGRNQALPLAPLLVAQKVALTDRGLLVDGRPVPLDARGRLLVDLPHPSRFFDRTFSLGNLIADLRRGETPAALVPDSIVVLLPRMSSGNAEFVTTPYGPLPGGLELTAVINSVLGGHWLRPASHRPLAIALAGALGGLIGYALAGLLFWGALGAAIAAIPAAALLSFAYRGTEIPWALPLAALILPALVLFGERARAAVARRHRLEEALEGHLAPERLQTLLRQPSSVALEPTARVVSVMFVDIVGFSIVAERQTPKEAFSSLKEVLAELTDVVLSHGGTVDKSVGDGLLCYFGYDPGGTEAPDHADRALRCAVEIQRRNLARNLAAVDGQRPLYPLRIGINTAAVMIGDVGSGRRLEFTLIGHGVNFAKRLESAAEAYGVMISASTRDLLTGESPAGMTLTKRFLQIKNYADLVEAHECDPLADRTEARDRAVTAYRSFASLDRRDVRWPVPPGAGLAATTSFGNGRVLNFSGSGIGIVLEKYLGRGVVATVELDSASGELAARLQRAGLPPLSCEVRWGKPLEGGGYALGLAIKNLSAVQKQLLVDELRAFVGRGKAAA